MAYAWESELVALSGYSDQEAANIINAMQKEVEVETITTYQLYEGIDRTEADALDASDKTELNRILGLNVIYVKTGKTRTVLMNMFPGGTTTRNNLLPLMVESGAKYDETCTANQVYEVRNS